MTLRRALVVVLCLLVLGLQVQVLVHPISHFAEQVKPRDTQVSSTHADSPCAQCALLSGGGMAMAGEIATWQGNAVADVALLSSYATRAKHAHAWFHSRAPPLLA